MSNNPVAVIAAFTALSCTTHDFPRVVGHFFNVRYESNAARAVSKRNWMTSAVTDVLQDGFIWQKSKLVARRFIYSGAASSVTRSVVVEDFFFFPRCSGTRVSPAGISQRYRDYLRWVSVSTWTLFCKLTVSSINWVPELMTHRSELFELHISHKFNAITFLRWLCAANARRIINTMRLLSLEIIISCARVCVGV